MGYYANQMAVRLLARLFSAVKNGQDAMRPGHQEQEEKPKGKRTADGTNIWKG